MIYPTCERSSQARAVCTAETEAVGYFLVQSSSRQVPDQRAWWWQSHLFWAYIQVLTSDIRISDIGVDKVETHALQSLKKSTTQLMFTVLGLVLWRPQL